MAGPKDHVLLEFQAPYGESSQLYAPGGLARRIRNFQLTPDGTLESVRGPAPYEPDRGEGYFSFGRFHGIFHAGQHGGEAPNLYVRAGTRLYRHNGWNQTWETLETGLSDDTTIRQVDQFCLFNDHVIWANGIDRPRVIRFDGLVTPLGFDRAPGPPTVEGPTATPAYDSDTSQSRNDWYANDLGYSWPGEIGTLGDVRSPTEGSILGSAHVYAQQWEDWMGNLSPLGPPSQMVYLQPQNTQESVGGTNMTVMQVDDLLRQYLVRTVGSAQNHCMYQRLYRTADMRNVDLLPRLHSVHMGVRPAVVPDRKSDAELGLPAQDLIPVPNFHVMSVFMGMLVVGVEGGIRWSQTNFPGTFARADFRSLDIGGAAPTALASHGGKMYAWTDRAMFDVTECILSGGPPIALAPGIGCCANNTVQGMPDGSLVWLAYDGLYMMPYDGYPQKVTGVIHRIFRDELNRNALRQATATIDPRSGEYRVAVTPAGMRSNRWVLCFDGQYIREMNLGIDIECMCTSDDARQYVLFAGRDTKETPTRIVFVMDHEDPGYTPPSKTYTLESAWMRSDALAMRPVNVRKVYIGLVDSFGGPATGNSHMAQVELYKHRNPNADDGVQYLRLLGSNEESRASSTTNGMNDDRVGTGVYGTAKVRDKRLFWRYLPADLTDVREFAFKIETTNPIEIAAFSFDVAPVVQDSKGRVLEKDEI